MIQITTENMLGIQKTKNGFKKPMFACEICGNLTRKDRCECIYICLKHRDLNKKPFTRSQCGFCWKDCPHRDRVWDSRLDCFVVLQKSSTQSHVDWEVLDMLRQSDPVQQMAESEVQRPEALVDQDNASEMSEDEVRILEALFEQRPEALVDQDNASEMSEDEVRRLDQLEQCEE